MHVAHPVRSPLTRRRAPWHIAAEAERLSSLRPASRPLHSARPVVVLGLTIGARSGKFSSVSTPRIVSVTFTGSIGSVFKDTALGFDRGRLSFWGRSRTLIRVATVATMTSPRTFWLFPFGKIHASSAVIDLDASEDDPGAGKLTRETALRSAQEWLETYQPPVLIEHKRDGMVLGRVVKLACKSREQLADDGVIASEDAVLASLELDDEVAEHYERGRIEYCSPGLALGYTDDAGKVWPLAITEVSLTGDPRMKTRQPRASTLREIQLSDRLDKPVYRVVAMSGGGDNRTTTEVIPMYDNPDKKQEMADGEESPDMAAMLAEVMRRLDDLEARMSAEDDAEEMADGNGPEEEMSDKTVAVQLSERDRKIDALEAKLATVEAERAHEKAVAHVEAALSDRAIGPEQRERVAKRCVKLMLSDGPEAVGDLVAALPKLDLTTRPKTGASTGEAKTYNFSDAADWRAFVEHEHGGDVAAANRARLTMIAGGAR